MELLAANVQHLIEILTKAPMLSTIFTTIALLAGFCGYFYGPYWGVRKVPGPLPLPLVGHLPLLAMHGPDVFSTLAKRYGPFYRFHLGRQPLVIVADPELCQEVAIKKFKHISNRSRLPPIAGSIHEKGIANTRGARWSTMRNMIISLYQPTHLANLVPTMQDYIESATRELDSKEITFSDWSLKLGTDIIGQAAFGVDFGLSKQKQGQGANDRNKNDDEVQEFINQHMYSTTQLKMDTSASLSIIIGLLVPFLQVPLRKILRRIPGTMDWKVEQTHISLTRRLDEIVERRMKENDVDKKDLLSVILRERESDTDAKNVFTPDYIRAVTYEHLLAGSSTTSFTLSTIIYLVACHPEVEEKVVEEIDQFGPRDRMPTADDLQNKFPYLDQVIKESMRFYTISPLIARETSAELNIGGYVLPKGTWVWLAPGALSKDPKHFPEPEKFKPERFDPNGDEEKRRHPYAHIPFGIGPRACIGQKFSLQEIKLSLIHLYRKYVFRHSPQMENPLEFQYGIVLNFKHGVKVEAIKRS